MAKLSIIFVAAAIVFGTSLWGCSKSSTSPVNSKQKDNAAVNESGNAKVVAALAQLPADDRVIAEKQKVCPVSGEALGEMGTPIKVDVKGQPVFICCDGCKEELLAKPDEYLAKLQK